MSNAPLDPLRAKERVFAAQLSGNVPADENLRLLKRLAKDLTNQDWERACRTGEFAPQFAVPLSAHDARLLHAGFHVILRAVLFPQGVTV